MLTGPPRVPRSMRLAAEARDAATDRAATPIRMAKAQHRPASRRPSLGERWRSGGHPPAESFLANIVPAGAIRLGRRDFSVATARPLAWQPIAMARPKAGDRISRRSTLARSCVRPSHRVFRESRGFGKRDERRWVHTGQRRTTGPTEAMTGH